MFASIHTAQLTTHRVQSAGLVERAFAAVSAMLVLRQQRAALARLDDAMLYDVGLSRAEVLAECARPMWDTSTGLHR